ncbi:MAG: DUF4118 domain-containing protein [Verrucomicrobiales bacterium]|nr:DUF4118 domain-containing protein [Verrucomicrobiales bacterium]
MIIWLVGVILVVLAAGIGFLLGGVRASICLVGTFISAFMAKMVGGWVAGLVPMIGFKNPIWLFYLPPVFGFILASLVFFIIALVVHHVVERRFRNSTDEYTFARWFRLNRRTGAAVGAAQGTVWLVLVAIVAYLPGYLATQLADEQENSVALRAANSFTHGMEDTGLMRLVERFEPATPDHYVASDILGLVYNNPALHSRLASYPPFLGLAEKPEISELARDPEINTLIQSRAGVVEILDHAKIRAVADNPELVNELLALDFADLEAYLRTGISGKYKDERLLGRWRLNVRRSIAEMKLVSSEKLPTVEFNLLRKALNVYLDNMTIGFTTDNKALVKVKAKDEQKLLQTVGRASATPAAAATPAADGSTPGAPAAGGGLTARGLVARALPPPQPAATDGGMSADLRQRYGLNRGGTGGRAQPAAQALAATPVVPVKVVAKPPSTTLSPLMSTGEGTWAKSGDKYQVKITKEDKEVLLEVEIKDNQMVATADGRTLVFDRI